MSDKETITTPENTEADKAKAKTEAANAKASEGTVGTLEDAVAVGYFGTAMSPVPTEVHEAGNEALRAELYGAAPVPEAAKTVDGPFASMEAAKRSIVRSNDLATVTSHPTLRGAVVNSAEADKAAKKDSK